MRNICEASNILEMNAKQHSNQHGSGFLACFCTCEIREPSGKRRCVTVHAWGYICVCCERPPSAAAPSSLENQSFTWSRTHSRILTLYRFQEPLFTPAPEETPWKKEPQAAKKHTKQQGKTVPNLIKSGKVLKNNCPFVPRAPTEQEGK